MSTSEAFNVRILDREYTVGVEPSERDSLLAAARLLEQRMRDVRGTNRMAAIDRVAVLAALNLAHELQQLKDETTRRDRELARTVGTLQRTLDQVAEDA